MPRDPLEMSTREFNRLAKKAGLSEAEYAIIQKDKGMPHNPTSLVSPLNGNQSVSDERYRESAWRKINNAQRT